MSDAKQASAGSHAGPTGTPGSFEPPGSDRPGRSRRRSARTDTTTPARRRRSIDVSTLASLTLSVPWFLYSFLVVGVVALTVGAMAGGDPLVSVAVIVVWLLTGALTFSRPVEVFLARSVFRARRPTPTERENLEHAWRDVSAAAGIDGNKYQLFVQDTDALNAFAASGHIVTATRRAVDAMPPHHLTAVLAHEFGHHIGGHAWSRLLTYWYALPARLLNRVMGLLIRLFVAVSSFVFAFAARLPALAVAIAHIVTWTSVGFMLFVVVMLMARAVDAGYVWVPAGLVVFACTPLLLPWLGRRAEYRADRIAAELGYGPALIEVFEDWIRQGMDDERTTAVLRARLFSTHPALAARIKRLDAYLRKSP